MRLRRTLLITVAAGAALLTAVPLTAAAATAPSVVIAAASAPASAPASACTTIDTLQPSSTAPVSAHPVSKTVSESVSQSCGTAAAGLAATEAQPAAASAVIPATSAINGYPSVGKFFYNIAGVGKLNCTASVINDAGNNPKQELVVTAAHCFKGLYAGLPYYSDDWLFAPEWHNNQFPYGKWAVKSVYIDSRWFGCGFTGCHENPRYDYAVFVVDPQHGHGVGHYTGVNGWHINEPKTANVRIVGIPGNSGKALVNVTKSTTVTINPGNYLARKAATPGFGDGSSGGPWFYSFNTSSGVGLLLGVTGGYESGGSTDSPSYASYWTSDFASLVATAAKHE